MVNEVGASGEPRGLFALTFDPLFGPFFWGKLLSNIGIWIFNIAIVVLVFEISGSPLLVGLAGAVQFLPQFMFVTVSGALADRGSRRLQLFLGRVFCVLGTAVVMVWLMVSGIENTPVGVIMVAGGLVGVGFALGGPAMQAIIPALVRPVEMPKAVALDNFSFAVGRSVGPALGGVLGAFGLMDWALGVALFGHLVFAVAVAMLPRIVEGVREVRKEKSPVRSGFRYVARRPAVVAVLLGVTAVGVGADPAITLAPILAAQLGGGADFVGLFASAFGLGAFLIFFPQAWLTARFGSGKLASVALAAIALGNIGLIIPGPLAWVVACFAISGTGLTLGLTALGTQLYARVADEYRGRVMSLWLLGFVGSRPISALMNGSLAEFFSLQIALAVTGVIVLSAAWLCRPSKFAD